LIFVLVSMSIFFVLTLSDTSSADEDLTVSGDTEIWTVAGVEYCWEADCSTACDLTVNDLPEGASASILDGRIDFTFPILGNYYFEVIAADGKSSVITTIAAHVAPKLEFINSPTEGVSSFYSHIDLFVSGCGTLSGQGTYLNGTPVELIAEPFDGWLFVGWYDGDMIVSTESDFVLSAAGDLTLVARFAEYYEIDTAIRGAGNIDGGGRYLVDTNAVLEAIPLNGYRFDKWIVNGIDAGQDNPLIISSGSMVIAVFEPIEYTISVETVGNGSVSGSGSAWFGDTVTLIPQAADGNVFWKWTFEDGTELYDNPLTISSVGSDLSTTAWFHPETVTVTTHVNNSAHGSCSPSATILWGNDVTLEAFSNGTRNYVGWFVNGELATTSTILTLTDVTENTDCEARFEEDLCDISLTKNCSGGKAMLDGTEISNVQKDRGTVITLSSTTDPGYIFDGWYVNSVKVSSSASVNVTVSGTTIIQAQWTYPKNPSINLGNVGPAPFYLSPKLSSEAGVSSVLWTLTDDNGSTKSSNKISPSLYVGSWSGYTLSASVTFADNTSMEISSSFDITQWTKVYVWRFQANPDNSSHVNETEGRFSYTFDRDWYEGYLNQEGPGRLEDNNIYVMAGHVTYNDSVIQDFARKLESYVESCGCSDYYAKASAILKFVQDFSYMYDDEQFGAEEYYMYPATFLIKERGDCEDHAFLYAALMKALGHKVILLSGQGHCAVGLDIDASGTYYRYISLIKYYYCEATATSAAGRTNYGYQDYGEIGDMGSNYNIYKFIPIPVM